MDNTVASVSGLKRADFQKIVDGKEVDLFFLRNENGCEVAVTNYGGSIVAIMVPDRDGKM
ncbi:MAG: galactose-1-epimerase, partial [Bacteroidaceae bacterium]|nr:galactose-1-epimerase [Bacteroidaceae bacterium]